MNPDSGRTFGIFNNPREPFNDAPEQSRIFQQAFDAMVKRYGIEATSKISSKTWLYIASKPLNGGQEWFRGIVLASEDRYTIARTVPLYAGTSLYLTRESGEDGTLLRFYVPNQPPNIYLDGRQAYMNLGVWETTPTGGIGTGMTDILIRQDIDREGFHSVGKATLIAIAPNLQVQLRAEGYDLPRPSQFVLIDQLGPPKSFLSK